MDEILELIDGERAGLVRRLTARLGGDHAAAEDLAQEVLVRAWQRLPPGLELNQRRAWLSHTARRIAIDELRRRKRRPVETLSDDAPAPMASEGESVQEALALLSPHEQFILRLRFEAGYSHSEIAQLLDIGEDAARKRVARARGAFLRARRRTAGDADPLILVVIREDPPQPYVDWLESAGARVRRIHGPASERDLTVADGIVFTGAYTDLDSRIYGEISRGHYGEPDLERDRMDLALINSALSLDLPTVGICRGGQLLNIASGGTLYQDVVADGLTRLPHGIGLHAVSTAADTSVRRLLGARAEVHSQHHQAVRKLGRRLVVTAQSPDGVVESIERADKRFAIGLQWHPEIGADGQPDAPGRLMAEALVAAARERLA